MRPPKGPDDLRKSTLNAEELSIHNVEKAVEQLADELETAADQLADELETNIQSRDVIIRRLKAKVEGKEDTTIPSEEELMNVIQHSDSDLDNYDYAKSYNDYYGIRERNPGEPLSPPSPINVSTPSNPANPGPSAPLVSTPPNDRSVKTPKTPVKARKSPVVIAIKKKGEKKKKPSPIKFPTSNDRDEQPEGEDVPLSRLITQETPRFTTRRETRQDLRIKLNSKAPRSRPALVNDRGPPSSRLRRKPSQPANCNCLQPKCSREHRHQPFRECPETSRSQWQKEAGRSEKEWFNPQICQTDSSEEENKDEITTDELGTAEADSSGAEN